MRPPGTGELSPIRGDRFLSMTLFRLPLEAVDVSVGRVLTKIGQSGMSRSARTLDINSIYEVSPPPGGAHPYRLVLYEPLLTPNTTVMINNLRDGWNSLCGLLAVDHHAAQVQIISTSEGVDFPQQVFFAWIDGCEERRVMLMRDSDKWQFTQHGSPFSFEKEELYSAPYKKNRLTRSMLTEYLRAMGWDVGNPKFWVSRRDAIFYEQSRQTSHSSALQVSAA